MYLNIRNGQRLIGFFMITCLLYSCAYAQTTSEKESNDWQKQKLRGQVKSLKATTFSAVSKNEEVVKGDIINTHKEAHNYFYQFDTAGFLTFKATYNNQGTLLKQIKWNGQKLATEEKSFSEEGKLIEKKSWQYDDHQNITLAETLQTTYSEATGAKTEQKEVQRQVHTYNAEGKLDYTVFYETDGREKGKLHYIYDEQGNLKEKYFRTPQLKIMGRELFFYDEDGNMTEEIKYNNYNDFHSQFLYRYNEEGKRAEVEKSTRRGLEYTERFDADGKLIEKIRYMGNKKISAKEIFRYDEQGNRILSTSYDQNGEPYLKLSKTFNEYGDVIESTLERVGGGRNQKLTGTYQYEYDEQGNWIKMTEHKNQTPYLIVEREVTYY